MLFQYSCLILYVYVYVYIYIYREREIYAYVYVYVYMYIYIYNVAALTHKSERQTASPAPPGSATLGFTVLYYTIH